MVTVIPFVNDVPVWILPIVGATALWRYLALIQRWRMPHVVFRMGWAFANFGLVLVSYGTINGLEAGTALLLLMSAMKLTESVRARDLIVVVYMSFFNIVAHALFDQEILATLYGAVAMIVVVAALVQVTRRTEPTQPRRVLTRSGVLLAQAVPLTLLMFVLFPRVPGPFWALPTTSAAVTGLSDTMNAGDISQLLQSGATAFRAEFNGPMPRPSARYWRGPVFDTIEGNTWSAGDRFPYPVKVELAGDPVAYDLTLEPHQRTWVFALDVPAATGLPPNTKTSENLQLIAAKPIKERTRFRLRSYTNYRAQGDGLGRRRDRFLDVSGTFNPRTEAFARDLRARHADDEQLIRAVLARFGEAPFRYTLRPPLATGASASDAFMFESKAGFCEHYASAFALTMRYAGIPARVVTGYQGGERNPLGGHLTVRQSDAHAWTEVWLPERGWLRIDPTAAVSPDRVERGIGSALGEEESLTPLMLRNGPLLNRLRFGWDAANAAWNRHVLGYGKNAQRKLLQKLGLGVVSAATLVALLTVTGSLVLGGLAFILARSGRRVSRDPLLVGWRRLTRRLDTAGVPRLPHEAPLAYAQRVAQTRPDLAAQVQRLAEQFAQLRYGQGLSPAATTAWLQAVRAFKPLRRSAD